MRDENFQDVLQHYRTLKNRSMAGEKIGERMVRGLLDTVEEFKNDTTMQEIHQNCLKLTKKKENQKDSYYQEFMNLVYFLSPLSPYMYTYDVDSGISSVIKLVDGDQKDFPMRFNSATLLVNNRIFVIGGTEHLSECGGTCWEYSFLRQNVKEIKAMHMPRREHAVVYIKNSIYAVGGWGRDGLTNTCEKILVNTIGRDSKDSWEYVKKLNTPKSAISLCAFESTGAIYAIGGLAKDTSVASFERLMCSSDSLPEKSADQDFSKPISLWEKIAVAEVSSFCEVNSMVGSFGLKKGDKNLIVIFAGAEKPEDSKALIYSEHEKKATPFKCPQLSGTAGLHNRKPLHANSGKDIYYVGFYDILHFNVERMDWEAPIDTRLWISYK